MPVPTVDFLLYASTRSLENLELSSLNRAANLSKTLKLEMDEWIEQAATAMMARWMIENRAELLGQSVICAKPKSLPLFDRKEKRA